MKRPLLILHLDGVGHAALMKAVDRGKMPFTASLVGGGYTVQPYRPGVPSTTPYAQAGILYGDNTGIAGFRWYDKRSGVDVAFGVDSTFKRVAHRYFKGRRGLVEEGAAIAACYDGGARRTFGLAYRERRHGLSKDDASHVVARFMMNPAHLGDVGWHLGYASGVTLSNYVVRRAQGRRPARSYVLADILEETFVHHLTRYAVLRAIRERLPAIYACFYAYDETAHAFGPDDPFSENMLRHVDKTLKIIFKAGTEYEVVVLSDHGQVAARPFSRAEGKRLDELVSGWVPTYEVRDLKRKKPASHAERVDGHILIAASGGLAHLYLAEAPDRLRLENVEARCPDLIRQVVGHPGVHFLLGRRGERNVVVDASGERPLESPGAVPDIFGDPAIVARQLSKLLSFATAGDIVLVGRFEDGGQVDFEDQLGAHGSIGGEQCRPFVLARAELGLDLQAVTDASELYGILSKLAS